jgi:putative heme-binding domain-containing protein
MDRETRAAAARTLAALNMEAHVAALAATLEDQASPAPLRETIAAALAPSSAPAAISARINTMRSVPQRLQLALAKSLAATPAGAEALLQAIGDGKASPRLLGDATVKERLAVSKPTDLDDRLKRLMKGEPEVDQELQKRIDRLAATFDAGKGSPLNGARVFAANCAVCHAVDGQGAKVGPQLDGISKRGVPRIVEDILDPSRNVDAAFRYNTFVLTDGTLIDGILRREEGETITIVDSTAKETTFPKSKIQKRVESKLSLMPGNIADVVKPQDLTDLLTFLMSK